MDKKRSKQDTEELRGIVRKLQKENQKLRKELSRYSKRAHQYEDLEEREHELHLEKEVTKKQHIVKQVPKCPSCNGKLDTLQIGNRLLITCEDCSYRKTEKKND